MLCLDYTSQDIGFWFLFVLTFKSMTLNQQIELRNKIAIKLYEKFDYPMSPQGMDKYRDVADTILQLFRTYIKEKEPHEKFKSNSTLESKKDIIHSIEVVVSYNTAIEYFKSALLDGLEAK